MARNAKRLWIVVTKMELRQFTRKGIDYAHLSGPKRTGKRTWMFAYEFRGIATPDGGLAIDGRRTPAAPGGFSTAVDSHSGFGG